MQGPRALHPIFYGSYDWHSCVHGYWLVLRVLERYPALPEAERIVAIVDAHFTEANVAGERAYLARPHNAGFERPYGWAWLLALSAQLERLALKGRCAGRALGEDDGAADRPVRVALRDLPAESDLSAARRHAPRSRWRSRSTSRATRSATIAALIVDTAKRWHLNDVACQAWGAVGRRIPVARADGGGADAARAAGCRIRRLVRALPADLARGEPATLFEPATVSDRSDGKIAHLDG